MTTGKIGALFQRLTVLIWDVPAAKNIQPVLHDCLIEILSLFAHYWHPRRGVRMQRVDLVGPSINAQMLKSEQGLSVLTAGKSLQYAIRSQPIAFLLTRHLDLLHR